MPIDMRQQVQNDLALPGNLTRPQDGSTLMASNGLGPEGPEPTYIDTGDRLRLLGDPVSFK